MSDNDPSVRRDFDKPSKEIALEQIYAATGYTAPVNKVTFGVASELDQFPTVQSDENSFVPFDIDPLEDARFVGDNGFVYRRLDLSEILPSEEIPSVPLTYPFTAHEALDLINSLMSTQLDELDVENDTYTAAPVTLRAKKTSVAWIGSKVVNPVNGNHQFLVVPPFLLGFLEDNITPNPYVGLSAVRLLNLINDNNDSALAIPLDFTFGKITTIYTPRHNTRIRIKPADTGTYVEQDVFYNRLDIGILANLPEGAIDAVLIPQVPFTIHGILASINAALHLNLTTAEVFNTAYTERQDTYTLQIRANQSVAWAPSHFEFAANHEVAYVGRTMEDGSPRTMEDGSPRDMELPPTP